MAPSCQSASWGLTDSRQGKHLTCVQLPSPPPLFPRLPLVGLGPTRKRGSNHLLPHWPPCHTHFVRGEVRSVMQAPSPGDQHQPISTPLLTPHSPPLLGSSHPRGSCWELPAEDAGVDFPAGAGLSKRDHRVWEHPDTPPRAIRDGGCTGTRAGGQEISWRETHREGGHRQGRTVVPLAQWPSAGLPHTSPHAWVVRFPPLLGWGLFIERSAFYGEILPVLFLLC